MRVAVAALAVVLVLTAASPAVVAQSDDLSTDGATIDVFVAESGDAVWNVSTTFALDSETDREAFRRLADDIENSTDPPGFDVRTAEELVAAGEQHTGRQMSLSDPRHTTFVTDNGTTGVVRLTFTWQNFAATNGDTITVGDVFGAWTLTEEQRLRIHPPSNFGLLNVDPDADSLENGTLTWTGRRAFAAGQPSVTYTRSVAPPPTVTGTETSTETPAAPDSNGPDLGFFAAVAGALLLGGALAYVAARRERLFGEGETVAEETADADAATEATAPSAEAEAEDAAEEAVDPALLSDEERVERLLEERGGRMKQADIVTETGWSNAKVSQLLSSMAEEDRVEKLRIGRENLISLPGAEADDEE
ncbi:MAG: helix-turn-helix transcriptional regulator [Halobacteriaceae archaeon]